MMKIGALFHELHNPLSNKNSVKYEPSWPVIPVMSARFILFPLSNSLFEVLLNTYIIEL